MTALPKGFAHTRVILTEKHDGRNLLSATGRKVVVLLAESGAVPFTQELYQKLGMENSVPRVSIGVQRGEL